MSKKTGYLLGMLLTIIICMILAWFLCCNPNSATGDKDTIKDRTEVDDSNAVAATAVATSMPFELKGPDGVFNFSSDGNFNFNASEFSILEPVSGQIDEGIGKLKAYFDTEGNANKRLDIKGYYDTGEQNTSAFANLGLARANAAKNYFVKQGINSNRINTYGELNNALVPKDNTYNGPLSYKLFAQAETDKASETEAITNAANVIKDDPLVLNFEYAEASVSLSENQRYKIGDISRYLDKVEGASITIEGHTDSEGTHITNDRLGKERAEFAKAYLVNNGIPASKIKTVSIGERKPIATNRTEEGRTKNRRAVVTIN